MAFSPDIFKKNFPLFQTPALKNLIYLDNAATTQKPKAVIQNIVEFYTTSNANTHRASHRLARKATHMLESVRQKTAHFLHAKPNEIIFCRGATEGLNLIASIMTACFKPGDNIILTRAEHHANVLPWQQLAQHYELNIIFLPDNKGTPDLSKLLTLVTDKTKVISLALASNVLGYRLPLEKYKDFFESIPAYVILDGAQALAHEQVNVLSLGCDFLVGSAHKMFGPTGIGFVYGKYELLDTLPPYQFGGEMIESVTAQTTRFALPPYRFEAGTLALADIAGFGAALDFLTQCDRQGMIEHEKKLTHIFHHAFAEMPGIILMTHPSNNIGITSFTLKENINGSTSDLALWLDEHNIATRAGYHCAQPLYESRGLQQGLRISVAPYNTQQDCENTIIAVKQWLDQIQRPAQNERATAKQDASKTDSLEYFDIVALEQHQPWQKKYMQLMTWGQQVQRKPLIQHEQFRITGCEVHTWLKHHAEQEQHFFLIDSESRIVRGLGALMLCWFQGKTTQDIQKFQWQECIKQHGLEKHLSPSRTSGFQALIHTVLQSVKNIPKAFEI